MLGYFTEIFVQDEHSKRELGVININNVQVAGDTRYDRVATIAGKTIHITAIEQFVNGCPALVAGSTWREDEQILKEILHDLPAGYKLIIAPHEVSQERIRYVQTLFPGSMLYSKWNFNHPEQEQSNILIIDNMGLLSSLYKYGKIAYVGGGFQRGGIHNILEPAVFGLPVLFGPIYKKFIEANELSNLKYGYSISNAEEAKLVLNKFTHDKAGYESTSRSLKKFMEGKKGATEIITKYIAAKGWF